MNPVQGGDLGLAIVVRSTQKGNDLATRPMEEWAPLMQRIEKHSREKEGRNHSMLVLYGWSQR